MDLTNLVQMYGVFKDVIGGDILNNIYVVHYTNFPVLFFQGLTLLVHHLGVAFFCGNR